MNYLACPEITANLGRSRPLDMLSQVRTPEAQAAASCPASLESRASLPGGPFDRLSFRSSISLPCYWLPVLVSRSIDKLMFAPGNVAMAATGLFQFLSAASRRPVFQVP